MSVNTRTNMIGAYGQWAADLVPDGPATYSFRNINQTDLETWRSSARAQLLSRLAQPNTGGVPTTSTVDTWEYDGLVIEKLQWQLPYGPPTGALLLKSASATGRLPGVLALHDHGGNKYLGKRKITHTADDQLVIAVDHQRQYYAGMAWANELAKRGYVVLVPDAFAFASRRVRLDDVPNLIRNGLSDDDPENPVNIVTYNQWAAEHEAIMVKSLLSAGTTWPGVFTAEDQRALDVLCAREDVDESRIGCGGLSGGGLRTVFLAGLDDRVRCAVCAGMMTTWRDFLLNRSYTHTFMCYVPLLPPELNYPEILGLRAPLPTLVLNNIDDPLFTLYEMKQADDMLSEVYYKAEGSENYRCNFYLGLHKFDRNMQADAFEWFDRFLA